MTRLAVHALLLSAMLLPVAAAAHPGPDPTARSAAGGPVSRTVTIGMADSMRFVPDQLTVKLGESVTIIARNDGQVLHEIVLGTPQQIAQMRRAMLRDPAMAHSAPDMAHVAPGASEQIVWNFDRAGSFEFACLLPGHYEAGMKGTVVVRQLRIP